MPLTQLYIEVPGLGDNSKNLEVEGSIAVGEKVAVSVSGLPADVSTSGSELRLRVLGPIGEDVATHGEWTYDAAKKTYATTLDLASVQAFRMFFPPPPPPRPHFTPPPIPARPPFHGYDPVAAAAAMQPPNAVNVRLVLELRDKADSDSDSDGELVDASLIGTSSIRLNYWPADWQTATLVDLANGRVYSKDEVDALLAEEARQRGVADAAEAAARAAGDAETLASSKTYADEKALLLDQKINTKYSKPSGGIPKSDLSSSVQTSLGNADTALNGVNVLDNAVRTIGGMIPSNASSSNKLATAADVAAAGGKFIVVQTLPSAASADPKAIYLVPRTSSETGNVYDEYVRVEPTTGTYAWEKIGSTEIDLSEYRTAAAQDAIDATKVDLVTDSDGNKTAVTVGSRNGAVGKDSLAVGASVRASRQAAVSFGFFSQANGNGSVAMSSGVARGANAVAIGFVANADKDNSLVWKGTSDQNNYYAAHAGSANFKPAPASGSDDPATGFFVGNKNLPKIISENIAQADWDESDSDSDSYIKNKPTLGTAASKDAPTSGDASTSQVVMGDDSRLTDARHPTSHSHTMSDITDYVPPVQAQADWDESDSDDDAFIRNKPTIPAAITVDSAMSTTSTNPVQNKVVNTAIDGRVPWANSNKNAITIGTRNTTYTLGLASTVVGDNCAASHNSIATGYHTIASAQQAHAEGTSTTASETSAHAEGNATTASGNTAHAEGYQTTAAGNISHAEGLSTYAGGRPSHAEGSETTAAGIASHADGYRAVTAASGNGSTASTPHDYAYAWQGVSTGGYYRSHGAGTFNINPVGGANGFYIGDDTLTSSIRQNTNYLAYASTTTLAPETAVYRSALNSDGTFPTITDTGIPTAAAYYQCELELTVPSTVPSTITGPTGWTWMDGGELPDPSDLSGGETIYIACRLDCTARTIKASCYEVA